jgi:hypothetical protein
VPTPEETIRLYAQLAEEHQKKDRPQERDRFLLLAADAALSAGKQDVAENFRRTLLARNPNHLLKPYTSLTEALQWPDIATYVQELRRTYPPERLQRATKTQPGSTGLGGKEGAEDLILPLDLDRARQKASFHLPYDSEPFAPARAGGQGMTNSERPFPPPRPPQQPAPQPFPPLADTGPGVFSLQPEPLPRRPVAPAPLPRPPLESPSGSWLGAFLFFVLFVAGAALFAWVFVRPFVPVQ